ncbi:MAG: 23S rRNA (adenine(2503)-C(2))-methyltransferase RlmN [Anaerolineae bacterium]|nr:23S rRNA (adenine(2503)-C(2))-methyltransferase RlmN [Anaerolineae bacterium]
MDAPTCLLDLSYQELKGLITHWGEPTYRTEQIWQWIYRRMVTSPDDMTNLPEALRRRLHDHACMGRLRLLATQSTDDALTQKALLEAPDSARIETVLMRYEGRNTLCVSSQVGCPVGCVFCATGQMGLERDLSAGEIVDQVLHFARQLGRQGSQLTNVVYMGMGEPMLNYDAVWRATMNLHHPSGMGMGTRRFTISTIGIVPGIERLAREEGEVGLAVSLHAPDNALRSRLVPLNQRYPIEDVLAATRLYIRETGRRVTFEYVLIAGINDAPDQAKATADLLKGMLCHVNLIPLNPVPGSDLAPSDERATRRFQDILRQRGIPTTIRKSRGAAITAACGQLSAVKPKHL